MSKKLKPCPFCGSTWVIHDSYFVNTNPGVVGGKVICQKCSSSTGLYFSCNEAIDAWNTRAEVQQE